MLNFDASAEDLHGSLAHMGSHLIVRHELPIHIPMGLLAQRLNFHSCCLDNLHIGQVLHIDPCTIHIICTFPACRIMSQQPAVNDISAAYGLLALRPSTCDSNAAV